MTKQVTITIEGPVNSAKTYLMEKIYDMLKAEGIETSITSPDDDFGIWKKWKESGEPRPTLKEALDRLQVDVTLVEKHRSQAMALDPHSRRPTSSLASEVQWEIETLRDVSNMFKRMVRHRRLYVVMIDDRLNFLDEVDSFISEFSGLDYPDVEFVATTAGFNRVPDCDTKPLVLIYPVNTVSDSWPVNKKIPNILSFLSSATIFIKPHVPKMSWVRSRTKPTGEQITIEEWARELDFTPLNAEANDEWIKKLSQKTGDELNRDFFNRWTTPRTYLDVIIDTDKGPGHSTGRVTKCTIRELLESNPSTFLLLVEDREHPFIKVPTMENTFSTPHHLLTLPSCFKYIGPKETTRGPQTGTEHWYTLLSD